MRRPVTRTCTCEYRLWHPKGFRPGKRRYPLVVFLHGAGERGKDLSLVMKHGPPRLASEGRRFPFFLAAPQCPPGRFWDPHGVAALVDELLESLPIDADRVYLTGISMGGLGTWATANEYPERFAAIVPVCGPFLWIQPERFRNLPTWCFHGALDEAVPVQDSIRVVRMLRAAGAQVRFTVYPDAGHDAWSDTYANPALYRWLLARTRKRAGR